MFHWWLPPFFSQSSISQFTKQRYNLSSHGKKISFISLKDVFTVNFDFVWKFITYLYWFDQLGSDVCTNIKKKTKSIQNFLTIYLELYIYKNLVNSIRTFCRVNVIKILVQEKKKVLKMSCYKKAQVHVYLWKGRCGCPALLNSIWMLFKISDVVLCLTEYTVRNYIIWSYLNIMKKGWFQNLQRNTKSFNISAENTGTRKVWRPLSQGINYLRCIYSKEVGHF